MHRRVMKLLTARDVWPEIRREARTAESRHVAVAFLGEASPKMLSLRPGDVLVANLSEAAIRTGATSVRAARAFFRRGVHLCNAEDLHAKLFVFDDTVIVGSANASENSAESLVEAAAKIVDKGIAATARRFVQGLAVQTVTPAYLRLCAHWRAESAPDRKRLKRPAHRTRQTKPGKSRVWVLSSAPHDFTTRRADDRQAQRRIAAPREFVREPLAWRRAPDLRPQDQIVIAHAEGGRLQVFPPGRFLSRGKSVEGDTIIYVEQPRWPLKAPASRFTRLVQKAFRTRQRTIPTRRIPSGWVSAVFQLWPKGYSAARGRR